MVTTATTGQHRRELARRTTGGIEITLYWSGRDNTTSIEIWQMSTAEALTFIVANERALEAFYHPFAHLSIAFDEPPTALPTGALP